MENQTNTYQRKVGFFGSVKKLGVTTISGANDIVTDSVTFTTNVTGSAVTVSAVAREAIDIWGADLIEDLQSDSQLNRLHREIERIQQQSEVDALKGQLEKAKDKKPVGRPAKG